MLRRVIITIMLLINHYFYSPAKERWLAVMQDGEVDQIKINHKQIFTITNCKSFSSRKAKGVKQL